MTSPADDIRLNMIEEHAPQLPKPPEPKRSCCCWGRVFHHWTQYVLVGTEVAGGAAAFAAFITNSLYVALIAGGIIVVGGVVVFIGIGCLVPQRDLEDQIEFYREKLQDALVQEQKLDVNIAQLNQVKDALQKEVANAKETVEELQTMLKQDTSDFDQMTKNIGEFQSQANGLVDLYKKFREMFVQVKQERDKTLKLNKVFAHQIKELGGTIHTLEGNEVEFSHGLERLDNNIKVIKEDNQALDAHLDDLHEFSTNFQDQVKNLQGQVVDLADKMNSIDAKVWVAASKSVKDLKAVIEQLKNVTDRLE
jgi:chromosome segregation ATPase